VAIDEDQQARGHASGASGMTCIDFTDIVTALSDFYTPDEVVAWLDSPHPQLEGKTPTAVIAEGRKADVMAIIRQLNDCVYV
jgi:uncharacterized protein (DUF2384 family)